MMSMATYTGRVVVQSHKQLLLVLSINVHFQQWFTGNSGSSEVDTVTANGNGVGGSTTDNDSATVTLTDVLPTITVSNSASPTSTSEPGGLITFYSSGQ